MAAGMTVIDRQIVVVTDAVGTNGHQMVVRDPVPVSITVLPEDLVMSLVDGMLQAAGLDPITDHTLHYTPVENNG